LILFNQCLNGFVRFDFLVMASLRMIEYFAD